MRILHVDTGRQMRGGQWQVLYLLEGLAHAGHEAALLARPGSPLYERARRKGLEASACGWLRLASLARKAEIIHAHDAHAHSMAVLAGGAPLVVSRRVAFAVRRGPLSRWKYARADHFVAVSEYVKEMLAAAGVEGQRVSIVYDGVPLGVPSTGGRRVLAPATADPEKGTALLRQAAALGKFHVVFSENLAEDLRDAGLFVYITRQEGLGSAALLAMAAGVPVVASRVGGLPEVVEHGRTGLLTGNTPEEIAGAVRRLLEDGELARRMGACGRVRVEERFNVEAMVRGAVAVYERVLSC